jgi:beta-lactamase regulating signal transducer with metallopeptidase domain
MIAAGQIAIAFWGATFWVIVHGTILAAIAWLLSESLLRRARPAVIAALWTVVLVKFLVPVGPAMPWSFASAFDHFFGGQLLVSGYAVPEGPAVGAAAAPHLSLTAMLAMAGLTAWALAAIALVVRRVRAQRAAYRVARNAKPASPELIVLVAQVARRIGLRRAPDVRVDDSAVPWVIGLRRAILVVPATLQGAALAAVVGHELAHLRRRDAWLRLVQIVAGALFFFWPVVRLVNRKIDASRELACDAWAIARGPLAATDYARVLVGLVRQAHAPAAALGLGHGHHLGRRVDALIARKAPRAGVGVLGVALLGAWTFVSLTGASRAEARRVGTSADCRFSASIAAQILASHPEADVDGDGVLTRAEACDFELQWALTRSELPDGTDLEPVAEGLYCNRGPNGDTSASPAVLTPPGTCTLE